MKINSTALAAMLGFAGLVPLGAGQTAPRTAFKAKTLAEKSVATRIQANLMCMQGIPNLSDLNPLMWEVLFWDPSADKNGWAVTMTGEFVTDIRDGFTGPYPRRSYKEEDIINPSLLQVDSNQALDRVIQSGSIDTQSVTSVEFLLGKEKGDPQPRWNLTFFGEKDGRPGEIGQALVSAQTGEILKMTVEMEKSSRT